MTSPTFPRFAAAPKCDPAQLLRPPDLLLDRPAGGRIPSRWLELASLAVLAVVTAIAGWYAYERGGLERRIAALERIEAQRDADRTRILGSGEAHRLMDEDRKRAVRAIEGTTRLTSEGTE